MRRLLSDRAVFYAASAALILFAWFCHSYNWDLVQAYDGFSPVTYVTKWAHPELFAHDFPLGVSIMDGSSFMHIYKYAYAFLGVHPDITGHVIILFEIIMMTVAISVFARVIRPDISKTALFLLILFVIASPARDVNLARFSFPFFEGHYYNVADFLRIMAFATLLCRRYIWTGLLIGVCFTVHPLYALMGGVFMLGLMLAEPSQFKDVKSWLGGLLALVIAALWTVFQLDLGASNDPSISTKDWFTFTFLNTHWYPRYSGVLTTGAYQKLLPFLSLMVLFLHYIKQRAPLNRIDKGILYAVIASGFLVVLGFIFAEQRSYPFLVKLCLIRACDLMVLAALPYVVMGLLGDITKDKWGAALPALALIYPNWSAVFVLLLVVPTLISDLRHGQTKHLIMNGLIVLGVLFLLGYAAYYMSLVPFSSWVNAGLYNISGMHYWVFTLAVGAFFLMIKKRISKFIVVALSLVISCHWLWHDRDYINVEQEKMAKSYKKTQLWSQENTREDTLFMVEPSISYGWRAYAQRSSFGGVREHYLISWMYNDDYHAFKEGQNRLKIYEMDIHDVALNAGSPRAEINKVASEKFNDLSNIDWHRSVASDFDVDYFVFEKEKLYASITEPQHQKFIDSYWSVAFQNDHFLALSPK